MQLATEMSTRIPVSSGASSIQTSKGEPTCAASTAAIAGTRDDWRHAPLAMAHKEITTDNPRRPALSTVSANRIPVVAHESSRCKKTLPDKDDMCAITLVLLISLILVIFL